VVTLVGGVLNGGGVVPAAAAVREVDRLGGKLGRLGLAVATSPESRTAPGRELVDLGRPLIQTRIHHVSHSFVEAPAFMVRPTRSLVVTMRDIVGALDRCKLTKSAALDVYFVGILGIASCEAANEWPTREPAVRLPEEACLSGGCAEELPLL